MTPWLLTLGLVLGGAADAPADRPPDVHRGTLVAPSEPCLTEAQRQQIKAEIDRNVADLRARGLLPSAVMQTGLGWPLKNVTPGGDPGVHGLTSFVDHDPFAPPAFALDYACGLRAFENAHTGTDFRLFPFGRLKMERSEVHVVAAAAGTIVGKVDGNPDTCVNGGPWNAVYVQHADGSTAWYGHLKNGTVTGKAVGETVAAAEYLGVVGSSGSWLPKLHFELHDAADAVVDPYAGPCNATTATSWWMAQPPYPDPAIVKLGIYSDLPVTSSCAPETTNLVKYLLPGTGAWFGAAYRDLGPDQPTLFTIQRPDGTTWTTWSKSSGYAGLFYESEQFRSNPIPTTPLGKWNFRAVFEGVTYDYTFYVLEAGDLIFQDGFQVGP